MTQDINSDTNGGGRFLFRETSCRDVFTPEDFSDEHRQIAATTEAFVADEISPINERIEAKDFGLLRQKLRECADLGLMMIDAPEEYGGLDLDKATSMLVTEKLAFSLNFGLTHMCHTGIGMLPLIYYGTPEQKQRFLPGLITTERIGAYCLTEPDSGSDALAAKTTATLSGDGLHYILNGTKQFATNTGFADLFTVFAKVDKTHFTAFLIERATEGLAFGPEESKMGMHGSSTCQVLLDNAKVPAENVLGEIGRGHKIAFNVLNVGRFKLGGLCVGQQKFALAEGARYAAERKQFNTAIERFGAIREKYADVAAMTFASESAVYRLAGLIDSRIAGLNRNAEDFYVRYQKGIETFAGECALVKVFCSEAAAKAIDEMLQIHGGYGYMREYPIEQLYRDERVQRIYEGTNEINRLLLPNLFNGADRLLYQEEPDTKSFGSLAAEKRLLNGMKHIRQEMDSIFRKRFADRTATEQECLLSLADMAISIFSLESALLRVEKALEVSSGARKELYQTVARVWSFRARQQFIQAAERGAAFLTDRKLFHSILEKTLYHPNDLLADKRLLADAVSDNAGYPF